MGKKSLEVIEGQEAAGVYFVELSLSLFLRSLCHRGPRQNLARTSLDIQRAAKANEGVVLILWFHSRRAGQRAESH